MPAIGCHEHAAHELLDTLFGMHNDSPLVAGMIYGSIALGKFNMSSALDVVALHDRAYTADRGWRAQLQVATAVI